MVKPITTVLKPIIRAIGNGLSEDHSRTHDNRVASQPCYCREHKQRSAIIVTEAGYCGFIATQCYSENE